MAIWQRSLSVEVFLPGLNDPDVLGRPSLLVLSAGDGGDVAAASPAARGPRHAGILRLRDEARSHSSRFDSQASPIRGGGTIQPGVFTPLLSWVEILRFVGTDSSRSSLRRSLRLILARPTCAARQGTRLESSIRRRADHALPTLASRSPLGRIEQTFGERRRPHSRGGHGRGSCQSDGGQVWAQTSWGFAFRD
jgi:hypothetical protein